MRKRLSSLLLILVDVCIVAMGPFISLLLRLEGNMNSDYYSHVLRFLPEIVLIALLTYYWCGLYQRLWRYASISELLAIIGATTISSVFTIAYMFAVHAGVPKSVYVFSWFLNIVFIGGSRLIVRVYYHANLKLDNKSRLNVLVVGAGDAGAMIAREVTQRYCESKKLIGFIDDAPYKQNQWLFGAKVLGGRADIEQVVREHNVKEIIIAMPSVEGSIVREIFTICKLTDCSVKTLPGIYEFIDGKVALQQLRNVDLEDLLRREPVSLNLTEISGYLEGKRVLITGAGGSIGSELCRQVVKMNPSCLILLGKGENSIYEIERELKEKHLNIKLVPIIADVRDSNRIERVFLQERPQVVFHAAAHKHVPLMEDQPTEAVRNNIFGTKNVAEAADRTGVEVFVMISTDKAVNPTSVMGATKRVAELIVQNMNTISDTKFVAVRFGNVLGSRGSVIPLFKKQILNGGPITITHPDMKRYFMTIPEATQLVLQAGAMAKGGEVFVLDMGEPVKIVDMARDLIELSGLTPGKDVEIKFTGLRPGEKLFEELLTAEEGARSTKHKKIYVANLNAVDELALSQGLLVLQRAVEIDEVINGLAKLVPTYQSARFNKREVISSDTKYTTEERGNKILEQYKPISSLR